LPELVVGARGKTKEEEEPVAGRERDGAKGEKGERITRQGGKEGTKKSRGETSKMEEQGGHARGWKNDNAREERERMKERGGKKEERS